MAGLIGTVQISHPGPSDDRDHAYWLTGAGAQLSELYGGLLGMDPIYIGYHKLIHADGRTPEIGFEYAPDDEPPRWGEPDRPTQMHLDIEVANVGDATRFAIDHGATLLAEESDHSVLADPVGHPFCLYPGAGTRGRIVRIVFDCLSPRALAPFYEELLDMRTRVVDTVDRVEIAGGPHAGVALAFQHVVCSPPRWPDPAHPAQLHLDISFQDTSAREVIERLGGVHLQLPARPDNVVYADPAGHPFCVGLEGWGTYGPAQLDGYAAWQAARDG